VSTKRLSGHFGRSGVDVPGQEFRNAVDGVVGDARQHFTQIGFGIEAVELRRTDQAVDRRSAFPTSIRSGKQVVLPAQSYAAQRAFGGVMPRAGLCRIGAGSRSVLGRISTCSGSGCRHNYRLSRNASNGSVGRKRSGARPDGVAWARARSLSCMSACK